jgi:Cysteine rich repeat
MKCLRDHDADLSEDCRDNVNLASYYQACLDDAVRLCPSMKPSGPEIVKCLRLHRTETSTVCQEELGRTRRR